MSDEIDRLRRGDYRPLPPVPPPQRVEPDSDGDAESPAPEKPPYLAVVGAGLLALLACVPHWVAISVAVIVAAVGIPIAWGFRRIFEGVRQRLFIAITGTLMLVLALAVASSFVWLRLGVLEIPGLPELQL